ncbi:MAG: FecR family protein [Daejeonella sp.]|uniref:FecR family protein n=1 Tax=Daejeonella sp. TaxID=2805397 RepID=UPI002735D6D5|nr:FecR family protein [Daejeonella sp.]MDP3469058.1 FecR family protein [Daejeonella sp.]
MKEIDKVLITKYVTRQANEEEIAMAKHIIGSSKVHEEFYLQIYETWQRSIYYKIGFIDSEEAYSEFLRKAIHKNPGNGSLSLINLRNLSIAAILLIFCAFAIYFNSSVFLNYKQGSELTFTEIKVPKGIVRKLVLPDGTKVSVNAGSIIKYNNDFGKTSRAVYLNGEAYFDIAKGDVPFIVNTDNYTIRDIGTVFNVKAYSDDLSFETMVIEGEVQIEGKLNIDSDNAQKVSVKKQQVFKLNYASDDKVENLSDIQLSDIVEVKVQKLSPSQLEEYTGWTEDLLVFDGKSFQEIIKIIERRYDVEIVLEDTNLKNYEYSGSFRNINDVEKALKIMKETTDLDYEKNGRVITIRHSDNLKDKGL